jgi:small subunit ribosomal protein S1
MFNETTINEENITTTLEAEEHTEVEVTEEITAIKSEPSVINYLDKSILNIKVISLDELAQYDEDETAQLDEMYLESFTDIKEGEVATGTVVNITDREVFIDIGFKSEGIVPKSEFSQLPVIGEEHRVFINSFEDHKGHFALSKEKAVFLERWNELKEAFEKEEIIKGVIQKRIKGGMVVDLRGVFAFYLDLKLMLDQLQILMIISEKKLNLKLLK